MDSIIKGKITKEWAISQKEIEDDVTYYNNTIRPTIKIKYLSHLVTTIEDMVNENRTKKLLKTHKEKLKGMLATRTLRLYSIILIPIDLKRRATTRYHNSGAVIYYNKCYDEKDIRILIAHELGHIVNKELLSKKDTEAAANVFAYIAMEDKNHFYEEECKRFISKSDIQIFNDISNICPLS